jgi:hypothetical protein
VLALVPDEWLAEYGPFASPEAHRAAYRHYLTARLTGERPFAAEVQRARADLV